MRGMNARMDKTIVLMPPWLLKKMMLIKIASEEKIMARKKSSHGLRSAASGVVSSLNICIVFVCAFINVVLKTGYGMSIFNKQNDYKKRNQ